ncbi:MAG: thiamine-phosphate synthase family protein [Candidatus Thorarchaeota archaeon]
MRPPCELVQKDFLPLVRAELARYLKTQGLSQSIIAENLGLTQAAVSKYLNQSTVDSRLKNLIGDLTIRLADLILSGSNRSNLLVREVCSVCMRLRIGSEICRLHKKQAPALNELDCSICSELLGGTEPVFSHHVDVLNDMHEALEIIENSETFKHIIPQVRANLVACDKSTTTIYDVVGVPGRITLVGGKAKATENPRFDASRHTAKLLLLIKGIVPSVRACLCISGLDEVVNASKSARLKVTPLPTSTSDVTSIADSFQSYGIKTRKGKLFGIHVPGGIGVEPILYLFGINAKELAKLSITISDYLIQT